MIKKISQPQRFVIINRLFFLYLMIFLLVGSSINHKKVTIRILNHLRDSARYINQFVEKKAPFDEIIFREAVEYYQTLKVYKPQFPLQNNMLGFLYYQLKDYDKSAIFYKQAITENPDFFGLYYNLGIVYYKTGRWKEAGEMFSQALSVDPQASRDYYNFIGHIKYYDPEDVNRMTGWLKTEFVEVGNGYTKAFEFVVKSYDRLKDYEKVYTLAAKACQDPKIQQKDFLAFMAGKAAYASDKKQQALYWFNQCLRYNAKYREAYDYLGMVLKDLGQSDMAAKFIEIGNTLEKVNKNTEEDLKLFYYPPYFELNVESEASHG
ncbi:MAG: tetratricopeptide repeat protein [Candidatus Omnitrophica bacterium]|nr:tetratricopeptide repeat protein [Candidatus Omnitrophota bacterium]